MRRAAGAGVLLTVAGWAASTMLLERPHAAPAPGKLSPALIDEHFDGPWLGDASPDGLFRKDGDWVGTGGNLLQAANASILPDPAHRGGVLRLMVPGGQAAPPFRAAEIASTPGIGAVGGGLGYGYYETSMRVTDIAGVCASFFWIEAPGYGPHEWDVEFLTNEDWIASADRGVVHFTLHPSNRTVAFSLPFNPSKASHRYGFLWTPRRIAFTVDGRQAAAFDGEELGGVPSGGFLMANEWTGKVDWGGGPPKSDAVSLYDWIRFDAGSTSIPGW